MAKIKLKGLMEGAQKLNDLSEASPDKNRVFGSEGHEATVNWIYEELKATRYYNVKKEKQVHLWSKSEATLSVDDKEVKAASMTYGPSGNATEDIVHVKNLGCTAVSGNDIYLSLCFPIRRRVTDFGGIRRL